MDLRIVILGTLAAVRSFKIEENKSYVRGATLTTCSLEHPHYYFSVTEVIVRMNEELIAKNIVPTHWWVSALLFPCYSSRSP